VGLVLRGSPAKSPSYIVPETTADAPTEFVSITENELIALKSPENGNGICRSKAPPAAWPAAPENHAAAVSLNRTVKLVPASCAPGAGVKVTIALVRSRGVEAAITSSVKLDDVIVLLGTDAVVISGTHRPTVIEADGGGLGNSRAWAVPST
jgi:hypothetical protein